MKDRRQEFIEKIREYRYIRNVQRILWIITIILVILALLIYFHVVGFYDGINKGIYFFNCGLEIVGNPGFFCD